MRRTFLAAIAALPLLVPAPSSAQGTGVFVVQGSGGISPGLDLVPAAQSVSFGGTMTVVGTDPLLSTYGCSFGGTEVGFIGASQGYLGGGCGHVQCPIGPYERAGFVLTWTCTNVFVTITMECVFRPHQTLPVTSYDMTCEGRYAYL